MRILYIVPAIDGGGISVVIYKYISQINKEDAEFELVVQDYGHKQLFHDKIEELGVKIHYVPTRRYNFTAHFKMIDNIIKNGNFDIIHSHVQNWSPAYLFLAKKHGVKVRIAHSHLAVQTENRIRVTILNIFRPLLRRLATDYFACGIDAGKYMWGKKLVYDGKLYIVNNAVEIDKFRFDEQTRIKKRAELGLEDVTVIGHVGRFDLQKNHKFLLEIFRDFLKKAPKSVLLLVGSGPLEEKIKAQVAKYGLEGNVRFLGNRDDVHELLNVMDAMVFPSLYEGLPVVGIEAQVNGLPILFSDKVTDEVCILSESKRIPLSDSSQKWANELEEILSNSTKDKRSSAYKVMEEKGYCIRKESEKLKQYYSNALIRQNKNKKNIVVFMNSVGCGGAERVGCIVAEYLSEKDFDVSIVRMFDTDNDYHPNGIKHIHTLPYSKNKYLKIFLQTLDFVRYCKKNDIDAVIVMGVGNKAIYYTNRILRDTKFILSERNDPVSQYSIDKVLGRRVNKYLEAADVVVFQTEDAKSYFCEAVQRKGVIIPNPIKDGLPMPFTGERKKEIVNFCRLSKQKNLPLLIDAFEKIHKEFPEYKLTIYGRGELKDELILYISKKGLESAVRILDFAENIHQKVLDAAMFVSSSDYEGISNSMIEAMAIGLPTICTDCPAGGAKMMIQDCENGLLVPVGDKEALYSAMKRLILDPSFANRLANNAVKIRERLNRDEICKKWIEIIN